MISRIQPTMREHEPWQDDYGVTKFLVPEPDGGMTGHRGVIIGRSNEGRQAILWGLTGEYAGQVINVIEDNEDEWPKLR